MKTMNKIFPYVHVQTVDAYFELPKDKREKKGIYLKPISLPIDLDDMNCGWSDWSKRVRKEYPVQGFIREYLFDYDNPVYWGVVKTKDAIRHGYYNVKRFIKPCAPRFRKAWKRHQYIDICDAIEYCNLALLLDFWEEEVVDGHVDWQSDEKHIKFYDELKASMIWEKYDKPHTLSEIDKAYDDVSNRTGPFDVKYAEVNRLEELVRDGDTKVLHFMIDNRACFWT